MTRTPDQTTSGPPGRDDRVPRDAEARREQGSRRASASRLRRRAMGRIGRTRLFVFLAALGPGMIAALADNDAGGITTWSVVGSRYGFSMLWLLVLITPVLAILQEMNARIGAATGRGMAALIRENFSLKITAFAILATTIANFGTSVSEFSGRLGRLEAARRAARMSACRWWRSPSGSWSCAARTAVSSVSSSRSGSST